MVFFSVPEDLKNTDKDYEDYLKLRSEAESISLEIGNRYDKVSLAVSCGAFTLSLTYLEKIATDLACYIKVFLIASWILFAISIICYLQTQRIVQRMLAHKIDILDREWEEPEETSEGEKGSSKDEDLRNSAKKWVGVSFWSNVLGFLAILLFASLALLAKTNNKNIMSKPNQNKPKPTVSPKPVSQPRERSTYIPPKSPPPKPKPSPKKK